MTTLDHSSIDALVDDIHYWQGGLFCFAAPAAGRRGPPWQFLSSWRSRSVFVKGASLWFRIEYCTDDPAAVEYNTLLQGERLFFVGGSFPDHGYMVSLLASGPGGSSVDNSQRQRLDKNLRGIFA